MKAYVEAHGCSLSFGESREIEDLLSGRGWDIVDDFEESDLAVLVTCVVIEKTERKMLKRVKALADAPGLIIAGCMSTACRAKAEAIAPSASFVAPGDLEALSRLLPAPLGPARTRPREGYGIVPISTGCLGDCSYCITKIARGPLKSRAPSQIKDAVLAMVQNGPREIQLTAQDTAVYGADMGTDLPALVAEICRIPFDFRLRIGMMNPASAARILHHIAETYEEPKVFKFLHLPVQSASDRLLEQMRRRYTLNDCRKVVTSVRSSAPSATLSTDLIVGYPGETREDHKANLEFISEIMPDIVNVTRFSARPGTEAAEAGSFVAGAIMKQRSREITELRFAVALERNQEWLGRTVNALSTERGKKGTTILRSEEYKQIVVQEALPLGRYHLVEVTGATPTYLRGNRVGGG